MSKPAEDFQRSSPVPSGSAAALPWPFSPLPLVSLVAALLVGWLPSQAAEAQTPYQAYESSVYENTPRSARGGVRFEMARAGGLLLGQKRGGSFSLLAGGLSVFTLQIDGMVLWHRFDGRDDRAYQLRLMAGITAIELYEFASWRLEFGLVFGERLRGHGRGYTEFGLGTTVSLPLLYGPDGWPLLRAEVSYGVAPAHEFTKAFRLESTLSLYPFIGTPVRALGFQIGHFWGYDMDDPYAAVYFGLIFGAPLR